MGKSNLLTSLSLDIETFKAHLKRISKEDYKVHQLDKDLLLEKTRQLYDNILQIEIAGEEKIEIKKEVEKPITTVEKVIQKEEPKPIIETPPPKKEVVEKTPEVIMEKEEKTIPDTKQEINTDVKQAEEPLNKDIGIEPKPESQSEPKPESQSESQSEPQSEPLPKDTSIQSRSEPKPKSESAYDLFSPSSNTVSDKFASTEDKSIASKLKQNKLTDLRDAIGINEKFLFINELFNGDMGRYNKAIDEINSMQNKVGSDTYIMELKIEKQWDMESDAYIKFKELVDRKFD